MLRSLACDKTAFFVTEDPTRPNIVFLNAIHLNDLSSVKKFLQMRTKNKSSRFIFRTAGPYRLYKKGFKGFLADILQYLVAICSGAQIIYQSKWQMEALNFGMIKFPTGHLIQNRPDINFDADYRKLTRPKVIGVFTNSSNFLKGFDRVLECATFTNYNVKFQVYGFKESVCKKLYPKIEIRDSVPPEELRKIFHSVDLALFTSRIESSSNLLSELKHAGTPVISFPESSNAEVLDGYGVIINDPDEFDAAILKLLSTERQSVDDQLNKLAQKRLSYAHDIASLGKEYDSEPLTVKKIICIQSLIIFLNILTFFKKLY